MEGYDIFAPQVPLGVLFSLTPPVTPVRGTGTTAPPARGRTALLLCSGKITLTASHLLSASHRPTLYLYFIEHLRRAFMLGELNGSRD